MSWIVESRWAMAMVVRPAITVRRASLLRQILHQPKEALCVLNEGDQRAECEGILHDAIRVANVDPEPVGYQRGERHLQR